jgi:hypothetical protein
MEHIDQVFRKKRLEVRSSRVCEFCQQLDPKFGHRHPMDQMVGLTRKSTAAAHLTEDGYVQHRLVELDRLSSRRSA